MRLLFRTSALFTLLLGTLLTAPSFAESDPLRFMANDKEESSVIVKSKDRRQAERDLGNLSALKPQFTEIAKILAAEIFNAPAACEVNALSALRKAAAQYGFPSQPENLKSLLIALRENDLIDDVLLAPMWRAISSYRHTPTLPAPTSTGPVEETNPPTELNRVQILFDGTDRMCPTVAFFAVIKKLRDKNGDDYREKMLIEETQNALSLHVISPELATWFKDLDHDHWQQVPMTLATAATTVKEVKNIKLPAGQSSVKAAYASQVKKKSGGLSIRLAFYQRFNYEQIKFMSNVLQDFMNLQENMKRIQIVPYDKDGKVISTTLIPDVTNPAEIYRACIKFLHLKFADEMARSDQFAGYNVTFEDLVMAGLETGIVIGTPSNLDVVMKVDDSWNPPAERGFKKVVKVVQKYGSPLLILIPPPFNVISSVGLTLLQTVILKDKKKPDPVLDGYSIF